MREANYAEEQVVEFLNRIDEYIACKNLKCQELTEEFKIAERLDFNDINNLDQQDCFNYSFMLINYLENVHTEKAHNESVILYCDKSLNRITARDYMDYNVYGSQDLKTAVIAKENIFAQKLIDFKCVAQARNVTLKNKEFTIRKKIDCLLEKGKRL